MINPAVVGVLSIGPGDSVELLLDVEVSEVVGVELPFGITDFETEGLSAGIKLVR